MSLWSTAPLLASSLVLNVVVLIPVVGSLVGDRGWVSEAYGPRTPARAILLSIYGAILVASALLLLAPGVVDAVGAARGLLFVQVVYKLTTPLTVGTLKNPVVISNLSIAAWHAAVLATR